MSGAALPARPLQGGESLYLDLLRALAALAVVLDHALDLFDLKYVPRLGHQAVVLFFVLSGYVITNTVDTRQQGLRDFMVVRLARLWSVAVPALALTVFCDLIGRNFGTRPDAYAAINDNLPAVRIGAALFFLSESWVSIQPLSNGVFWSLCAEFWYYAIFAMFTFLPPGKWRLVAVAACMVMAGFKALLLLPIWLMGVALQRREDWYGLGPAAGIVCFVGGLSGVVAIWGLGTYDLVHGITETLLPSWLFSQLAQARYFLLDWLFAACITLHFIGARRVMQEVNFGQFASLIRRCAGLSFATFLFHPPLLRLCSAFLPPSSSWLSVLLTLAVIVWLGRPAEASKARWRARLTQFAVAMERRLLRKVPMAVTRRP